MHCRSIGIATALGGALYAAPAAALVSERAGRLLAIGSRVTDSAAIALTFDDGPHPKGTPAVLDRLALVGGRATFFLSGEQVARYPELAREICAAGHEIALHGYRHRFQLGISPGATMDDISRGQDEVVRATNVVPALYRPPYGVANAAALVSARRLGMRVVLWSRWGRDWERGASAQSIARLATSGLRGGEIVLLHDSDHYGASGSWSTTAEAVTLIHAAALEQGFAIRAVTDADSA